MPTNIYTLSKTESEQWRRNAEWTWSTIKEYVAVFIHKHEPTANRVLIVDCNGNDICEKAI